MLIDIYILDCKNRVVGTVGYCFYSTMTIQELINKFCVNGNKLMFG